MNAMNNMQEALRRLQSNPKEFMQRAGVKIPEEMMNDPKAMVMHLLQSGQVSGPMRQMIMPMINNMNTIR